MASTRRAAASGRLNINEKKDDEKTQKSKREHNWVMDMFEKHLRYSSAIFGGEPISAAIVDGWSRKMSSDELWAKVHEASESFGKYMTLVKGPEDKILEAFNAHHLPVSDIEEAKKVPHWFHDNMNRGEAQT